MLLLWTEADATNLRKYVGPVIADARIPHKIIPNLSCFPKVAAAGDVVLACGTKALDFLIAAGVVPKNRTITSLREQVFWFNGIPVLVSFDCGLINRDYARLADVTWDILLAARYHNTGGLKAPLGDYRYVESLHEIIEEVEARFAKTGLPVDLACDLETKSLDPYNPEAWIIAASFSIDHGKSDVLYFEKGERPLPPPPFLSDDEMSYWEGLWCQIHWLLTTNKVSLRGANFKYDENWLVEKWGVLPSNQKFDTVLVGTLLDENRSNSLKMHSKLMTEMGGYEDDMNKYDFSCLEVVPKPEMLNYIGGDSDATFRVAVKMKQELLKDRALSNFYVKLLQPSAKVFAKMERTGVLVDQPYYAELKAELESEIARLSTEMLAMLPAKLRYRHHEKIEKAMAEGKSPFIPALMKDFYFTPMGMNLKPQMLTAKTKEPSTSVDHLLMFGDVPEAAAFVEKFKELGSATKTYTTYVVGFLKHLRADGRFHSSYMLFKGEYGDDDESGTNCLVAGSNLLTQRGWIPVVDVRVGDKVLSHAGNWKPITDLVDNGVKKVFKVTTSSGHVLRCTPNHKFFTPSGWVRTDKLVPGTEVHTYGSSERWLPVAGFSSYAVSSWGRVRNQKTLQIVSPQAKGPWGHLKVCLVRGSGLRANGDRKDFSVHRLVASHFLPNPSGLPEVRHLDGVAGNNCVWNLCWGSSKDNSSDARSHGTLCREGQKNTKLDWEKVAYIRSHGKGFDRSLALELGVSRELVRDVRLGLKWITPNEYQYSYSWGSSSVVSVEYLGDFPTYDATVQDDHSYVVEGLITHNTGRTSAKDPAIQCLPSWVKVLTTEGYIPIGELVSRFEEGEEFVVLTHTGKWRRVIGSYRNGVQPVFDVSFESGKIVPSTANHPYLTGRGWVRTDSLITGDSSYELRSQDEELHQPHVPQLGGDEEQVFKSYQQGLAEVRGAGYPVVREVENICSVFGGHGGEANGGDVHREAGCEWGLPAGELRVGNSQAPRPESPEFQDANSEWKNTDRSSVGRGVRYKQGKATLSTTDWDAVAASIDESSPAEPSYFQEGVVRGVKYRGEYETFDITVEDSHSFVADGVVVHNTVPKHNKWAKKLRRAFIAPPGYVLLNCVSPETKILTADLRWVPAGTLKKGDKLLGFDEELPGKWTERCLRESEVLAAPVQNVPRLKITFASGRVIYTSKDHRWLGCPHTDKGNRKLRWIKSSKLRPGKDKVRVVLNPWEEDRSYEAGWIAGVLDGEGWLDSGSGTVLGVGQADGLVWDTILTEFSKLSDRLLVGLDPRASKNSKHKNLNILRFCNMEDVLSILGSVRPKRLLAKNHHWIGKNLPRAGFDMVVSVEDSGVGPVVALSTSTGTYVADGLASHNCDFSQGELRIAAVLAEEPKMIEAYANGMDLHSITAAQLAGYEMGEFMLLPEDLRDELRSGGKAGNFGLLYGMQALGFKDYAFYSYGVKMTEEEAFLKRQAFFDLYSKLPEWHEAQKNFAKMHGYVRSPLGRVRHLPLIGSSDREARSKSERQSVNSPVQSCLSDMMQLAMVHIDRLYGHEDIHFCMMCHDAVTLYVPEVDAVEWAKRIKGVMETLPLVKDFNWNSPLKFVADAEIGVTFDALKKLKGI